MTNDENNSKIDDRSSLAKAIDRGSQVVSACLAMVLPIFLGLWVDRWLGTVAVFTVLGLFFGMAAGIWGLFRVIASSEKDEESGNGRSEKS